MSKKKQYPKIDLEREIHNLIADRDKLKTVSEISDWLVRLYTVAAQVTIVQKECRTQQLTGEKEAAAKTIIREYVPDMFILHRMAEDVLTRMKGAV